MYVTPVHLASLPDSLQELSELLQIDPALLRATIDGADRAEWSADECQHADDALAQIQFACEQASGEVDARLVKRGYRLPFPEGRFPVLTVWARAIARYHLHQQRDRTGEETGRIERDYRNAIRSLDAVAQGQLSLGAEDPLATDAAGAGSGSVRVDGNSRMFSRKSLGGL